MVNRGKHASLSGSKPQPQACQIVAVTPQPLAGVRDKTAKRAPLIRALVPSCLETEGGLGSKQSNGDFINTASKVDGIGLWSPTDGCAAQFCC